MTSDDAWLAGLFSEHARAVRAFAFRRIAPDLVDDVVAEVFTLAWRSRSRVPDGPRTRLWLYRAAGNVIGHHHRSSTRRLDREFRAAEPDPRPDPADAIADQLVVRRALRLLSAADAEVLRLAYWEDLPPADLAFVLGCTTGAARVRLHRARRHLQEVLADASDTCATTVTKEER
jgi:RNA polymerase sigma-70 factor (ECF subfamily)